MVTRPQEPDSMKRSDLTPELAAAALEFLFRFSRFEFALKKAGYLKSSDAGKKAEPNWDMFVKRNRARYEASAAARALVEARPRQQVVMPKAQLGWQDLQFAATEFELQKVTLLLRLVRNNLFHGGQPADAAWDDADRTATLLDTARLVLDDLAKFGGLKDYERSR
jgi:hypothetical protein